MRLTAWPAVLLLAAAACQTRPEPTMTYPATARGDVVDDYFGTKVPDPYRWMEDLDSPAVADWVAAQNRVTFAYLETLPLRDRFKQRITQLWDYPKVGVPVREGGRYFYTKNSGLQRQAPLYMRASLTSEPSLVLDPNVLSPDGTLSLQQWAPSPDGKLLAYGMSEGGADWRTIRIRDVETGKDFSDEVKWMRFSDLSWTGDSKGFFYSRYPEPPQGKALEAALSGQALYYHRVGTPQSEDRLDLRAQRPADVVRQRLDDRGRQVSPDLRREGFRQQQPAVLRRSRPPGTARYRGARSSRSSKTTMRSSMRSGTDDRCSSCGPIAAHPTAR